MAQRGFLCGNQLLRQIAALFGKVCETRKDLAIAANEVQAGQHNSNQSRRKKQIELALHAVVNSRDAGSGLLLSFVILHKQARNRCAERLLASLERHANLIARFGFLAALRKREHAVYSIPELRNRLREKFSLVRRTAGNGQSLFEFEGR